MRNRTEPCQTPSDDTIIWRYFDFAKFVSLLDRKALFFPSASNLEDPFEGALPFTDAGESFSTEEPDERRRRWIRGLILVSSWHINSDESFAMWKLYSKSIEAIGVRTTVRKLRESLRAPEGVEVYISKVEYLDYRQDRLSDTNYLRPYLCKSKPYSYENEVRAIVDLYGPYVAGRRMDDPALRRIPIIQQALRDRGLYLEVDLERVLEEIYVSPTAGSWFRDLVRGILPRFGVNRDPRQSVLSEQPIY